MHRCALGAQFPPCPEINIELVKQWEKLEVKYNEMPDANDTQPNDLIHVIYQESKKKAMNWQ